MRRNLFLKNGSLELRIRDDGVGFDSVAARGADDIRDHLGVVGMEERVELVGGQFAIRSSVGNGTEVHASFPAGVPDVAVNHVDSGDHG